MVSSKPVGSVLTDWQRLRIRRFRAQLHKSLHFYTAPLSFMSYSANRSCVFVILRVGLIIVNLKTIVDHCPQNFENHQKTIDSNGWALKKHSMVMVQRCQKHRKTIEVNGGLKKNINHSIALKN